MTLYNTEKLEALKEEYIDKELGIRLSPASSIISANSLAIGRFIEFIKEIEKASTYDPNQLEIPFRDEDNSK